ncbi:hypothetical protein OESDEN_16596 [Oesophagostomum dentatum]|uniref:Uncharacterized protein n=1 Tax=Oesophagostomum dentatum TaxID=61180 RepID=A0A0B1SEI7_OESDE|nr:hypothetical protein OESDEN_16596 [Oesophagostomum dentatum]
MSVDLFWVCYSFLLIPFQITSEEAEYVLQLLKIWVQRCYSTLRCLRIFAFIRIDANLSLLLNRCLTLTHLTISRIEDVSYSCFDTIESLELNGCGMGYSDDDLEIGKCLTKYFPSVHVIGFREVCFDPVLTTLIRSLTPTALRYKIYQIICVQQ